MYPFFNLATTFLSVFVVSESRSTLLDLYNTTVFHLIARKICSTLFSSRLRRITLASVQALPLRKREGKRLDVLAKQPVATAERPVRARAIDESRARTQR